MNFKIYTDTGKTYGPYGSLPLAQKWAQGKLAGDKRIKVIELRPVLAGKEPFNRHTVGSFYKTRE